MSETDWGQWCDSTPTPTPMGPNEDKTELSWKTINDLGEYEILKVFSYFTFKERIGLSAVCLKWKQMIDNSFKSVLTLDSTTFGRTSEESSGLTKELVCLMIQKCCNVRHIVLSGMFMWPSDGEEDSDSDGSHNIIDSIVENCSHLQSIDFGVYEIGDHFLRNANYFRRVKKIITKSFEEKALNSIIDSERLESIDISRNDRISKLDFNRLGPQIRQLFLTESEVKDFEVIRGLTEGNGKMIEVLSIDIKDKEILSLICDNLVKLKDFRLCLYSENCDFNRFSNLIDLKTLHIEVNDCSRLSVKDFTDLIRALKETKISELKVELSPNNNIAINDDSLQEIRQNCPSIEKLVIRGANSLTGAGMYSIAKLKFMRHLDLKNCLNITDQIDFVITSCPLLRELILHNCSYISKGTVETFSDKAKAFPTQQFYLDVVDTNVSAESLPLSEERPKNLKLLYEFEDCIYDCDHGWDQRDGYHSGPEDYDPMDELDYYVDNDDNDYYDDYGDEDYDYDNELS